MENAITGIVFGCIFSFFVLMVMTQNIIICLISIFSIQAIIVQMLASIHYFGWKFGLVESTCVIVFIGISVDYVVHFSHQYMSSAFVGRQLRTIYAYKQMSKTIIGGSITSCFSGFFLVTCEADSLNKFGILLLITIISSLLTSLIFHPSLLMLFGPNDNQGDISGLFKMLKGWYKRKINGVV
jgi:predicted RND superfamily exporter protein